MARQLRETAEVNLYRHKSTIKILVAIISILIVAVSVYYNNFIVDILKERERRSIDLFAQSVEFLAEQGDNANVTFINEQIIKGNTSIPVILADQMGEPTGAYLNLDFPDSLPEAELFERLRTEIRSMRADNEPVQVVYRNGANEIEHVEYVFYHNSDLLRQLSYYPVIQLSTILLFGALAYLAFSYSRTAEQNRVWVGLAKETAHQLGTPLSSLMAWLEYLRADERTRQHEALPEMAKDLEKLHMITERFSNIGSVPVLEPTYVPDLIQSSVNYLQKRISSKVKISVSTVGDNLQAQLNPHLFGWVVENVIKNAVDAMSGIGTIDIRIAPGKDKTLNIDITDNGKGITKANVKKVFEPGFTTKKRGWGLGLTLAKRIIDHYHGGRIYVKQSEPNAGTTFRIVLRT